MGVQLESVKFLNGCRICCAVFNQLGIFLILFNLTKMLIFKIFAYDFILLLLSCLVQKTLPSAKNFILFLTTVTAVTEKTNSLYIDPFPRG